MLLGVIDVSAAGEMSPLQIVKGAVEEEAEVAMHIVTHSRTVLGVVESMANRKLVQQKENAAGSATNCHTSLPFVAYSSTKRREVDAAAEDDAHTSGPVCTTRKSGTSEVKPTFEVCTTDVLDSMKLPTSAHVLTVDRQSKF